MQNNKKKLNYYVTVKACIKHHTWVHGKNYPSMTKQNTKVERPATGHKNKQTKHNTNRNTNQTKQVPLIYFVLNLGDMDSPFEQRVNYN